MSFEIFRKGEKELNQPFLDQINNFPYGEVLFGIQLNTMTRYQIYNNIDWLLNFSLAYSNTNFSKIFYKKQTTNFDFQINYYFKNDF